MDPLVRGTLRLQELLAKASGALLGCVFAVGLWAWSLEYFPNWLALGLLGSWLLSTAFHLRARHDGLRTDPSARFDTALFFHLAVGLYALVLLLAPTIRSFTHWYYWQRLSRVGDRPSQRRCLSCFWRVGCASLTPTR